MQARLQAEVQAAAAAEARLGLVMDAVERCQVAGADLDELADAYSALRVSAGSPKGIGCRLYPEGERRQSQRYRAQAVH